MISSVIVAHQLTPFLPTAELKVLCKMALRAGNSRQQDCIHAMELYYVAERLYLANQDVPAIPLIPSVPWEDVQGVAELCVSWERRAKQYQNSRPPSSGHLLGPPAGYEAAQTWTWATAGHPMLLLRLVGALFTLAGLIEHPPNGLDWSFPRTEYQTKVVPNIGPGLVKVVLEGLGEPVPTGPSIEIGTVGSSPCTL